jgi:hypothetical protein
MGVAGALSQYEQGGYLGSPILSSAVLSTRDHPGAGLDLPRLVPHSRMPLGNKIERVFCNCQEVAWQLKVSTEPRHYNEEHDVVIPRYERMKTPRVAWPSSCRG